MTNEQRKTITDLRHKGYGYTAISKITGLSKDSVKAYCRSHNLAGVMASNNTKNLNTCLNCGKPIIQKPKTKKRKFCCSICRTKWWNTHQWQVKKKTVYNYICPVCGKAFSAYGNKHRIYCSHSCYISARFKGGAAE